jgi:hypothetical protein
MSNSRMYEQLHPLDEYDEDLNAVLWWHLPVCEPPFVGYGPGLCGCEKDDPCQVCAQILDGWLTHFSLIPIVWDGDGLPRWPTGKTEVLEGK